MTDSAQARAQAPSTSGDRPDTDVRAARADIPVVQVTLLEDRARVLRRGSVSLPAGLSTVECGGVAPVLADVTLTTRVRPADSPDGGDAAEDGAPARVVDSRVHRRSVVAPDAAAHPAATGKLKEELEELERRIGALTTDRRILEHELSGVEAIASLVIAELSQDVAWGRDADDAWARRLDELRDRERRLRERAFELVHELRDAAAQRARLSNRIAAAATPAEVEWAGVQVDLAADRAGVYTLELEYVVPGACWRPQHTARLVTSSGPIGDTAGSGPSAADAAPVRRAARVVFSTDACVWQNTGEDWTDAELVLSTERASLGTEPPPLASDILRATRKREVLEVEAREQEIQTTGLGEGDAPAVIAADLPGIDDGGDAVKLRAPHPATVPSDGRPHRVPLRSFDADTEVELIAMPERAPCAIIKSVQDNRGGVPILAGPVDLVRDSGFAGRTQVMFVAAGERFALGWGPDPEIRLKRRQEVLREKGRLLSSWIEQTHTVELKLSNLGAAARTLRITERVPVSEIDKVKIAVLTDDTTGRAAPDADGLIEWVVALPPRGHDTVTLRYQVKRHEDVAGL